MQASIEPVAGPIAGEHSASTVCSMRRRGEADHEQVGVRVTKPRHRLRPIVLLAVGGTLLAANLLAPFDQTRTRTTRDDVLLETGEKSLRLINGSHDTQGTLATLMAKRNDPPKPTLVLLVRHGQTPTTGASLPGRAPNLHLADKGIAQAESAAKRIAGLGSVAAVYASPMERTRETAAPIARARKLRVRQAKGLIECDFGEWTGQQLGKLRKLPEWRTVQRYPSGFRFPGGESFGEMQSRSVDAVHDLVLAHPGETIVAVSHADVIKAVVAAATGTHLDLFQRIVVSPCSITAILYTTEGPVVLTVNSTGDDLTALVPS
jgi:probable phosphomutase (TIGR03848 family)